MMTSLISSHRKSSGLITIAFAVAFAAFCTVTVFAQDFEIPKATGNAVSDFAGVIDDATEQSLENTLINLKTQQKIEFAVVTVKTTGERDIFDYALAIGRQWGIGPANDEKQGFLLLVAVDDRKAHALVSRHLQGELTDGTVGSIQREYLVPAMREGKYGEGITNTIRAYIDTLASKRGFSTAGIYQQNQTPTRTPPPRRRVNTGSGFSVCGVIVVIIVIVIFLFASRGRGGRGGGGGGFWSAFLIGSLLSSLTRGGSSSGGWSSGGFGGSSGDSGGGFGGFGGGGDFDGGGAGSSW